MKLATLKDGSRDGHLVVVSRDLSLAHHASGIATRLQQVLDDWNFLSPQLEDLYATLNGGKARHAFAFEPRQCMAPLPRAYQWAPGPALAQGSGNGLLGPCDDAFFFDEAAGIDMGAGLAVVTGDIPMGAGPGQALDGVRLLLLVNAWTLRQGTAGEPAPAFAPLAVTPDELGEDWREGHAHLPLRVSRNGRSLGTPAAGEGLDMPFGDRLAALARARPLRAGSIVGGGRVGGGGDDGPLRFGDTVRIEARGRDGQSVFGALVQRVVGPGGAGLPRPDGDANPLD